MNIVSFGLMVGLFCIALFRIALFRIALFRIAQFRIAWACSGIFGTANCFGSLAGSTVTNIGRSVVNGSLGV